MENGERVRLIGVDTPETKHPNKPLSTSAKRLLHSPGASWKANRIAERTYARNFAQIDVLTKLLIEKASSLTQSSSRSY